MTETHCVNCGFNLTDSHKHKLEPEAMSVIQQWVTPQQVTKDNLVCDNCWLEVSTHLAQVDPIQQYRCINCGRSVRRIRNYILKTDTDRDKNIRNVIIEWIQPREVSSFSRICQACWRKAQRAYIKLAQKPVTPPTQGSYITLPNYTRAASSEVHCFVQDCRRSKRLTVPTAIRVKLLCEFSFYVPQNCRICNVHLNTVSWDGIIKNGINNFTAAQIEDLLALLKSQTGFNIDFENIGDSDDHLVYYWLGVSKVQFRQILDKVPKLRNTHRGSTGLAAYLTKLRTGDSDERLSALFKIPRSTLERLMKVARELTQDFDGLEVNMDGENKND